MIGTKFIMLTSRESLGKPLLTGSKTRTNSSHPVIRQESSDSELEEVKRLRSEMNHDNNYSRKDGIKTDDKLANISEKLYKLKQINM